MDKIIVKSNTDMQRVIDWSAKLEGMAIELPFAEAEIEFQDELMLLKFKDEGSPMIAFELWVLNSGSGMYGKLVSWRSNMSTSEITDLKINVDDVNRKAQLAMLLAGDNTIWKCVEKFKALMLFAVYYREEIRRTKVVSRTAVKRPGNAKRKCNQRKPLTIRKYTISDEMLCELPAPKIEWHGYKSSFSVRGHYRKTKTGKVIWVRPYSKMGVADKKADNEYVL